MCLFNLVLRPLIKKAETLLTCVSVAGLWQCGRGQDGRVHCAGSPRAARAGPRLRGHLRAGGGASEREDVHGAEPGENAQATPAS